MKRKEAGMKRRSDKERLDWLEFQQLSDDCPLFHVQGVGSSETIRGAIDAAMDREEGK